MAFQNASECNFHTVTISDVRGNQINNHYNSIIQQKTEHTDYDEFFNIKLGAIYRIRDLFSDAYPRRWDVGTRDLWEVGRLRVDRTVSTAEIHSEFSRGSKFTVVSYSGPEAKQAWEHDFQRLSRTRNAKTMQLFGLNRSHVPTLIIHNELVPIRHVYDQLHVLSQSYVRAVATNWVCRLSELWIAQHQGNLIRGLRGPDCRSNRIPLTVKNQAFNTELFQEDVLWRFLSQLPFDRDFDRSIVFALESKYHESTTTDIGANQPIVISMLESRTLVATTPINWQPSSKRLTDKVIIQGKTRFTLVDSPDLPQPEIGLSSYLRREHGGAWMSQSLSLLHRLGMSTAKAHSNYKLIMPELHLTGDVNDRSDVRQRRYDIREPIFLFILPIPVSDSTFLFWSRNETGRTRLSDEDCSAFGLPRFDLHKRFFRQLSWPIEAHQDLERWQVLRGFDPMTTDFTRYLGYPVFKLTIAGQYGGQACLSSSKRTQNKNRPLPYKTGATPAKLRNRPTGPRPKPLTNTLVSLDISSLRESKIPGPSESPFRSLVDAIHCCRN